MLNKKKGIKEQALYPVFGLVLVNLCIHFKWKPLFESNGLAMMIQIISHNGSHFNTRQRPKGHLSKAFNMNTG